jgi:TonB-dependent SusC/RagA subfamily outer membrane receptor
LFDRNFYPFICEVLNLLPEQAFNLLNMLSKKIRLFIALIAAVSGLIFISFTTISTRSNDPSDDVATRLAEWYEKYPQEKVYLHLDKQTYTAGENIWFRAYFVDATSHRPSTHSNILIVELINSFGKTSMTRLLKLNDGFSTGDFMISDTVPSGLYEIRAYTSWMRNFGDDYFYKRQIEILNPEYSSQLYRDEKLANKRLKNRSIRKSEKLDIQFFPEGGDLVTDIESRIAFKAVNELGQGVDIRGEIHNKKGDLITEFKSFSQGMGAFSMKPAAGEKYKAVILRGDEKYNEIPLPEPLKSGFLLSVNNLGNKEIIVNIKSSMNDQWVSLIGQTRGHVYFNQSVLLENRGAEIKISRDIFPTGILQFTVFNQALVPQCERLVFINHNDFLNIGLETDRENYGSREKISLKINVKDPDNYPVAGNFSLSVTSNEYNDNRGDFYSGIVSYLILSSDLKGNIQNPEQYFEKNTPETREALDYLMMTQGWRRFTWENVIGQVPLKIDWEVERGLAVAGKVTREFFGLPLKFLPVTLTVLSGFNDIYNTRTNEKGNYLFNLPDYEDTLDIEITSSRLSGRKNLVIYIDETKLPEKEVLFSSYSKEMEVYGSNTFRPIPEKGIDKNQSTIHGIHGTPDNVIYVDDKLAAYNNIFDIIKGRVPGVMVQGNSIQIRGPNSFFLSTEPLYLIDDVPVDAGAAASLNPQDVERIEILKGPSTAIYGSRGANGVVAIYTKRGKFMKKGVLETQILGFYRPREFYSPRYGTRFDQLNPDDRITLFWAPSIMANSNGQADTIFFTSDVKGKFDISLEGVTPEGKFGAGASSFNVE